MLQGSPIQTAYSYDYGETKHEAENKEFEINGTPAEILPQLNMSEFTAASMDRLARIIFAGAFIIFNLYYWIYYTMF